MGESVSLSRVIVGVRASRLAIQYVSLSLNQCLKERECVGPNGKGGVQPVDKLRDFWVLSLGRGRTPREGFPR